MQIRSSAAIEVTKVGIPLSHSTHSTENLVFDLNQR